MPIGATVIAKLIKMERKAGMSGRDAFVDLIKRAGWALCEHADEYVPDQLYNDVDQVVTVRISPRGPVTVSTDFEFYLQSKARAQAKSKLAPQGAFFISVHNPPRPNGRRGRRKGGEGEDMADETAEQAESPKAEAAEQPTDWEAEYRAAIEHSREWERKAKANKGAAEELEKLKTSQMTDLERAQREAKEAKAKLAELEAQREWADLAARLSKIS